MSESGIKIIHGDSFQLLPEMGDESVDHVFTDPPYSAATHSGARRGVNDKLVKFDPITAEQFVWLCRQFVRVARRWVVMTCDWRHAALAESELPDEFVRLGVWTKNNGMPQLTGDRPATGWEAVLILHRKGKKRWNRGGHPAVWRTNIASDPIHPTEKPTTLLRQWVRDFTDAGDTVLDPFSGSAAVAVSCWYEARKALAIEKDPEFYAAAADRVARLTRGGALVPYKPRAEKPTEETLF